MNGVSYTSIPTDEPAQRNKKKKNKLTKTNSYTNASLFKKKRRKKAVSRCKGHLRYLVHDVA